MRTYILTERERALIERFFEAFYKCPEKSEELGLIRKPLSEIEKKELSTIRYHARKNLVSLDRDLLFISSFLDTYVT